MESSRRDLSNDMAEHRPTLENNKNTYRQRFGFTDPKQVRHSPKRGFVFTVVLTLLVYLMGAQNLSCKKAKRNISVDMALGRPKLALWGTGGNGLHSAPHRELRTQIPKEFTTFSSQVINPR